MTQLAPIRLDDGTIVYIEVTEDANPVPVKVGTDAEEDAPTKRGMSAAEGQKLVVQSFQAVEGTIRAYTTHTLNAFKQMPIANVDKVTLEFGIKVGAEACVPYITKGTAESNLKIIVECSFPKTDNSV